MSEPLRIGLKGQDITLFGLCITAYTSHDKAKQMAAADAAIERAREIVDMYAPRSFFSNAEKLDMITTMFQVAMKLAAEEMEI